VLRFLLIVALCGMSLFLALAQDVPTHPPYPTRIRNVVYRTRAPIPVVDKNEAARRLRHVANTSHPSLGLEETRGMAQEYARALLEDHGYWKASIETRLLPLPQRAGWVDVVFQIDEGAQYYLSRISWTSVKEFTDSDLHDAMAIRSGEVASRGRISQGLQEVNKLYASRGYINCVLIPDTKLDDASHAMALNILVDEGAQFHFGELDLPGLDAEHREMLLQRWQAIKGTTYSFKKEEGFFRSVLWPADPKQPGYNYWFYREFIDTRLDEREHAMNFSIRFAPPPPVWKIQ